MDERKQRSEEMERPTYWVHGLENSMSALQIYLSLTYFLSKNFVEIDKLILKYTSKGERT